MEVEYNLNKLSIEQKANLLRWVHNIDDCEWSTRDKDAKNISIAFDEVVKLIDKDTTFYLTNSVYETHIGFVKEDFYLRMSLPREYLKSLVKEFELQDF